MRPLRIGSDAANARTSRQIFDRRAIGGVLNPPEFPIRKMVAFAAQETEYVLENDSGLRERRSHTNCFAAVAMQRPGRIDNRRRDPGDQGRFTIASGKAQCSRAAIPERANRRSQDRTLNASPSWSPPASVSPLRYATTALCVDW